MCHRNEPNSRSVRGGVVALILGSSALFAAGSALGQEPQRAAADAPQPPQSGAPADVVAGGDDNATAPQEIVVTARRRSELMQHVPVAVSAFDQEALQRQDVRTLSDLQLLVPSAYVSGYAHGSGQQFFTLRGQGESGLNTGGGAGGGPGVVGYFSEVPTQMSGPGLYYDLQSVQVLNGPQGTLFGRNTTGGAVLFEPRRPNLNKLEGYGQFLAGDYGRLEGQAALNVPLADDTLAIRVAGQRGVRDGYTKDVNTGTEYDNRNFQSARMGVLLRLGVLENYFIASYVGFNEHGPGTILDAANPANFFVGPAILGYLNAQNARGPRQTALDTRELDRQIFYSAINKTSAALGDNLTLRNIVSFSKQLARRQDDEDGTTLALLDSIGSRPGTWLVDEDTVTEEVQVQGEAWERALTWQTGLFFEHDYTPSASDRTYVQHVVLLPVYSNTDRTDNGGTSTGVYGQGSYKLSRVLDGLSLTAGYRHTWDYVEESYSQSFGLQPFAPAAGDPCSSRAGQSFPNCFVHASARHGGTSYTIGLDYQATPSTLLYLASRQGYKSGGFNIVAATLGNTRTPFFSYNPEKVRDVEIGAKADWVVGSMKGRTNVALFNSWYTDAQVNTSALIDNLQEAVTVNAARATIRGIEVQNSLQPTAFSEATLTYSYLDAYYNSYVTPLGQDLTALPYAYAPKNKVSVTGRIRLSGSREMDELWLGVNFNFQDHVFAGFTSVDPGSYMPAYGLLGLRMDWQRIRGLDLDAAIFVTNLTDRDYRIANEDLYSTIGTATTIYGEPRMIAGSLRYHF